MSLEKNQKWLKFRYMVFLQIINKNKIIIISILLFLYVMLNLVDGKRGLISYVEKKIKFQFFLKKRNFSLKN